MIRQAEEALGRIVESSQALVSATRKSANDIARLAGDVGPRGGGGGGGNGPGE